MRAGLYLRISKGDDDQTATIRQRQDCEAFVQRQGWQQADVFEDVDLSAYDRKVKRPQYERLIAAVRDREIDVVVAWHVDRLSRQQSSFVRLMDALEDASAFLVGITDGVDTRQETGRFIADLLVSHARMSSADASRRIRRRHEELASAGKMAGLGRRSYGYQFNQETRQLEIVEVEAVEIREAVRRILTEGASVYTILKDWHARGLCAPGGAWQQANFRRMITSARIAGQRDYEGSFKQGNWPGIISADELRRVRQRLLNGNHAATARTYPLSGLLRCGKCDTRMRSRSDGRKRRYVCAKDDGGCGSIARSAAPLEEFIRAAVCIALDGVDLREYIKRPAMDSAGLMDAIRSDEQFLEDLARERAQKLIASAEYFASRDVAAGRLEANRKKIAKQNGHGILNNVIGAGVEVARLWEQKGLDWQRVVVGAVIDHVDVLPTVRGQRRFDPAGVEVRWKY